MILVVNDDWGYLAGARNAMSCLRMRENVDYMLLPSFDLAREVFMRHRHQVTGVILDHNLDENHLGSEIAWAIRNNPTYDHIRIARCSAFNESGYPDSPHFGRSEVRQAIEFVKFGRVNRGI